MKIYLNAIACLAALLILLTPSLSHSKELDDVKAAIKAKKARWQAGETSISKLSPEERKMRLGLLKGKPPKEIGVSLGEAPVSSSFLTESVPASLDWSNYHGGLDYVTGVRNQSSCGSCWAFGSVAALESKVLINNNTPGIDLDLSEQVVISCSGYGSCAGGFLVHSYFVNPGIPLESCYPYSNSNGTCANACSNWQPTAYKIPNYTWLVLYGSQYSADTLKHGIYTYGPVVVTMDVYTDFYHYTGGVYSHVTGVIEGGHAVLLYGYDDANSCFLAKNSWGTYWGSGGFFRIAYSEVGGDSQFGAETLAYGNPVNATSSITTPYDNAILAGLSCSISGTASNGVGTTVQKVEVSTDNGVTWADATGTSSWSYTWTFNATGSYTIKSRVTDSDGYLETPGPGKKVTVSAYNSPELQHYNWNANLSGGNCAYCHVSAGSFLTSNYRKEGAAFCYSCHNTAGVAHGGCAAGSKGHPIMVDVTSFGQDKKPVYGNVTAGEYNNQPFSRLASGKKIVCATCHNVMRKSEDHGRVWELTTTSDRLTYTMQRGGWTGYGKLVPRVYRDATLWGIGGPAYSNAKKSYLVNTSEYTYNESTGAITFASVQPSNVYIYVTLDYPYLRSSPQDNRLCADCHAEAAHKGNNCLTCHQSHNTDNLAGIRGVVRTTDRSERAVKFLRYTGVNSFADGDGTRDGICEVCHTTTKYYRRDGSGFVNHSGGFNYNGVRCTSCHTHASGFAR